MSEIVTSNTTTKKPIRILCLHGYKQNVEIFKKSIDIMNLNFIRYNIVFDFLQSNILTSTSTSTSTSLYCWWSRNKDFDNFNNFDTFDTLEQSIEHLKDKWQEDKYDKYDGILGFDQGGILAEIFTKRVEDGIIDTYRPSILILASIYTISTSISTPVSKINNILDQIKCFTILIHGSKDNIIPLEEVFKVCNDFDNYRLVIHHGGHFMSSTKEILYIIRPTILRHFESINKKTSTE